MALVNGDMIRFAMYIHIRAACVTCFSVRDFQLIIAIALVIRQWSQQNIISTIMTSKLTRQLSKSTSDLAPSSDTSSIKQEDGSHGDAPVTLSPNRSRKLSVSSGSVATPSSNKSTKSRDSGSRSSRDRRSVRKPKLHAKGLTGKMFLNNER